MLIAWIRISLTWSGVVGKGSVLRFAARQGTRALVKLVLVGGRIVQVLVTVAENTPRQERIFFGFW